MSGAHCERFPACSNFGERAIPTCDKPDCPGTSTQRAFAAIFHSTCQKCGAVEQQREVTERAYRWRKEGPPPDEGWTGPVWPHAQLLTYERTKIEKFYECKFACPNAGRADAYARVNAEERMALAEICFRSAEAIRSELRGNEEKYDQYEAELFRVLGLLDELSRIDVSAEDEDET